MLSISENANINYLAKIVKIDLLNKHSNADKLQIAIIDFQNVVVGMDAKIGDLYVFFPLECAINAEFLSFTNSFRDKELNNDKEQTGFFEKTGRVRAVKLRGEKSMGYLVPVSVMEKFTKTDLKDDIGKDFDTINDILICKKYFVPIKQVQGNRQGRKPKVSRLIEGQVRLHVDTENLRKNMKNILPDDWIGITYKTHGSSFWCNHVLVKRKLNIFEKLLKLCRVKIIDTEYDYIFGSRKVVKNGDLGAVKEHFYGYDIWEEIKDEIKDKIPKGFTVYGEALGYLKTGGFIQKDFDYSCEQGKKRLQIYRVTCTNADGICIDLATNQIKEFCERSGLEYVHLFYSGKARHLYPDIDTTEHWHANFIQRLERDFLEKDCFMCKNKLPEEGIVLRKEGLFSFESYKLKSYRFLERETKLLDEGIEDTESIN